jgi:hypothetical protein
VTPTPNTDQESNNQTNIILTIGLVVAIAFAAFFAATKHKTPSQPNNTLNADKGENEKAQ